MAAAESVQQTSANPDSDAKEPSGEAALFPWGNSSAPSLPTIDSGDAPIDSALSRTTTSSPKSGNTSEHVQENGRTYHLYKEGKYPLPNDEQEQNRLDLQHALFGVTLDGKLHLAPIGPNPQNVLDVATGTGIWAIEFAQQYPSAKVLGTDLSAIQPANTPSNCRFEINDAEDKWTFSEKFDYIHGRALLSCFKDPASVLRQAFASLAPGGYLELQDGTFPFQYIGEPPVDSDLYKWNEVVVAGAAKSGRPWTNAQYYKRWMEEIGFEDVVETQFFWPTNTWAEGTYFKHVSLYWQKNLLNGLEAISLKVMGVMGWPAEEIHGFLEKVKNDLRDRSITAYLPINVVYGRKPSHLS